MPTSRPALWCDTVPHVALSCYCYCSVTDAYSWHEEQAMNTEYQTAFEDACYRAACGGNQLIARYPQAKEARREADLGNYDRAVALLWYIARA